ncbi:MAG: hypothetical protein O3B08_02940 [Proteobacteria bacterium]|nr:hypothetical protein [Pseudomonadota bacterium]
MDRSQLRNMIESGRSVALDCYSVGKTIPAGDPMGRLFQNDVLNKSILIKRYEKALPTARQSMIVNTLVYFPYDFDNPFDGGESISFSDGRFYRTLGEKVLSGRHTDESRNRIDRDMNVLGLLDSMHSLDPFLFKSKAEQAEIESGIHPSYFAISSQEWDKIRIPIREKISRLVTMALGTVVEGTDTKARDQYVERFLTKIWQARDVEGIEPFIKAMQISPEKAPEVFFAWKAVCYYQVQFSEMLDRLKTMYQWVGHNQLCYPVDFVRLPKEQLESIKLRRELLRQKMKEGYIAANKVINAYELSYKKFVDEDKPQLFIKFLGDAENSYLGLAAHVSVATHSVNLWKWYVAQYDPRAAPDAVHRAFRWPDHAAWR